MYTRFRQPPEVAVGSPPSRWRLLVVVVVVVVVKGRADALPEEMHVLWYSRQPAAVTTQERLLVLR